jgi:hypothetical protein
MAAKPSVCADLPGAPECFFIQLNQCYYFKLYSYAPYVACTTSGDRHLSPFPPRAHLDRAGS